MNNGDNSGRKVIWIDPHFEWRSPSTKSLLSALPYLLELGWQIETWCIRSDIDDSRVQQVLFSPPKWLPKGLECIWFGWIIKGIDKPKQAIVHTIGDYYWDADVSSVHFDNWEWFKCQLQLHPKSLKDYGRMLKSLFSVIGERCFYARSSTRLFLSVSESIGQLIAGRLHSRSEVEVLANVLDHARYNFSVKDRFRNWMREGLGFSAKDRVFVFASTGHYLRKGAFQAVECLARVRSLTPDESIKFLIVGVEDEARKELEPAIARKAPDWLSWIVLARTTREIERYYAAGDAFFLPSRFETFGLVALEASACGLPLLITPFYGSEMYLDDGKNGMLLPWDTLEMAIKISKFVKGELKFNDLGPARAVSAADYAAKLDRAYARLKNKFKHELDSN